jgi:hypothetical protein
VNPPLCGGHVGPSSGHIHEASCGSHQGPRATPAFCNDHAACVFPSREAGMVLGDRLDPMLLEACAQPVVARHAPTVVAPPDFLDSQVAPWDSLVDLVALRVEYVVDPSPPHASSRHARDNGRVDVPLRRHGSNLTPSLQAMTRSMLP